MTARRSKKPTKGIIKPEPIKPASPGNGTVPVQPKVNGIANHQDDGASVPAVVEPTDRNELGQFVRGHNGGPGRPPGSKNKLIEDFLADFHDAWRANGADALRRMVKDEPSAFVRAAVQLMPKDVLVEARGAGLVVVETPAAIKALLEALPDLGVLPLNGSATVVIADGEEST
jgi:hypothetical protein